MSVTGLLSVLLADPVLAQALEAVGRPGAGGRDLIAPVGLRPLIVAAVAGTRRTVLVVTATGREAEDLQAALTGLLAVERVALFPSWETLPHERLSPRADTVGRRLAVLRRLNRPVADDPSAGPLDVVLCPVRSLLQPMVPGLGALEPVRAFVGAEIELDAMVDALAAAAYSRVDLVEKRGEFAVRGGIVDVFPPTAEHPLRVEFWGDTVEEIRPFRVADQRSLSEAEESTPVRSLWAPPCRELLLDKEVRARAAALRAVYPELDEMLGKIAEGIAVEGMEALSPVLVDRMELLVDQLPAGTLIVAVDPERVRARAADLGRTSQEFLEASWSGAAVGGQAPIDLGSAALRGLGEVRTHVRELGLAWWSVAPFAPSPQTESADTPSEGTAPEAFELDGQALAARAPAAYHGETERALADIRGWLADGWAVVLVVGGHGTAQRVLDLLSGAELPARLLDDIVEAPTPGLVSVTCGQLSNGFLFEPGRLAVLTETDLTSRVLGATKDLARRLPSRRKNGVDPLALRPGDYVVHEQHGVGRYVEMTRRTVAGNTREYVVVEYAAAKRGAPPDRLYVPTDQLEQMTRYVGGESPTLHRLGGADWQKAKGRARKAVKQIAGELIRLYAARTSAPGHAFAPDTPWQRELEDAFGYVETPDQMSAIDDVKADMEKPYPMDRVICGDVGYGKTEIAVRAAFKAVQDGKQVAVLVPTTLLAQQHFATFSERYSAFPVTVRSLSRFSSPSETAAILAGLADGTVDVVIGTHRLLSTSTKFKDLGLIIVDEEQRFGVEHKEKLKALRVHVDVLTMSATPIPRTLEMSISGIREMSTIATPPEERHPVLTFVGAYADKQIQAAVRRELLRDGQVFYVHNRVESIDKAARRLADLVPEARIATAHGQMNEHVLEQVIVDFWERRSDVLVCTTIVETGLDISNANTLIVERADMLGLAQLHQLRGRVGRSRERGYAYFLYPGEKPLTETAHERLATIAQHTELGAGMYVAMKDLEIRGAGNLLGGEQSGHIEGVGFDLYVRMVGEAVAEYKAGPDAPPPPAEVRVELPIDAHIPHDWLSTERLRLEAYHRIAAVGSTPGADPEADIRAVRAELTDRYGDLPAPVENLLAVARFRNHLRARGVEEATLAGPNIRFAPMELRESQELRLQRLYPRSVVKPATRTILVPRPTTAKVAGSPIAGIELLDWARGLVDAVLGEPAAG